MASSSSSLKNNFSERFSAIGELLACSVCHGELRHDPKPDTDRLICAQCGRVYPVMDGIPVLIPQER
jgi:uncharacterized protein YbaR (Trm112 family)